MVFSRGMVCPLGEAGLRDREALLEMLNFSAVQNGILAELNIFRRFKRHINRKGFELLKGIHYLIIEQMFYLYKIV